MTAPEYANYVSKLLAAERRGDGPPPTDAARADAIVAIEGALAQRRARASQRRTLSFAVAAAAAVALAAGATSLARHRSSVVATTAPARAPAAEQVRVTGHTSGAQAAVEATVEQGGAARPFVDGVLVQRGSRVVARGEGSVSLALSTGTNLTLSRGASLEVVADGASQVFALAAGEVEAKVAKLKPAERFFIRTDDAEVEVRGTTFRVARAAANVACGEGTTTRVSVTEGVVVVRERGGEHVLRAGDEWPTGCAPETAARAPSAPVARNDAPVQRAPVRTPAVAGVEEPATARSRLEEQNDLFAKAVAAKQAGKGVLAASLFDEVQRRFPGGPLAESAAAERMRSLEAVDARRAAGAARDYLARYPAGFARAEAERLAKVAR